MSLRSASYRAEKNLTKKSQSPANGKNLAKYDRFCTFGRVRNSLKRDMKKAPQVGLEPTTLRLTAGSNNYCLVLQGFASRCFHVLSDRKTNGLTSCFYLPHLAVSCFELRLPFGKNLAKLFSLVASAYRPNIAAKGARTGVS